MHIPQSQRWDAAYQKEAIDLNFKLIEQAISEKKELIIFPESAFPLLPQSCTSTYRSTQEVFA